MLASVFLMQPLGQISGNVVALLVVLGIRNRGISDTVQAVDVMWRLVIGIGVVPGVLALAFRVAIPESPRFLLDIEDDPIKAEFDATNLFGEPTRDLEMVNSPQSGSVEESNTSQISRIFEESITPTTLNSSSFPTELDTGPSKPPTLNSKWHFSKADIIQYFWIEGNWRTLFGTAISWLLLDFGFYGIGLSSPQFLAKTWGSLHIRGSAPMWTTNDDPKVSVYSMFLDTSVHALVILNVGSFVGGALLILFANKLNRVSLQKYGFLVLAAIFIAIGVMFITVHKTGAPAVALYAVAQLAFNFGTCPLSFSRLRSSRSCDPPLRSKRHDVYSSCGALSDPLPSLLPRHFCRCRQTR